MMDFKKIGGCFSLAAILAFCPMVFASDSEVAVKEEVLESQEISSACIDEHASCKLSEAKIMQECEALKKENTKLKKSNERLEKRLARNKSRLEKKKDYISPRALQRELDKVKADMTLEFTTYMTNYIKENSSQKVRNIDLRGLFSRFINITYNNKGDTILSPITAKGTAKGALGGVGAVAV